MQFTSAEITTMKHPYASLAIVALVATVYGSACSTTFTPAAAKPCAVNNDCSSGNVCNGSNTCVAPAEDPIRLGMSVPLSGTTKELGIEMRNGVQLAIDVLNDEPQKGGYGRPVVLETKDDGYEPPAAQSNARDLTRAQPREGMATRCQPVQGVAGPAEIYSTVRQDRGPGAIVAMIGSVGTPTMVQAAPVALETGTVFFGAFTGAGAILRNGSSGPECSRFVFNVRTGYGNELRAALEMLVKRGVKYQDHLISFDQKDAFGDAGYNGLIAAYNNLQASLADAAQKASPPDLVAWAPLAAKPADGPYVPIKRVQYTRNDVTTVAPAASDVIVYLTGLLQGNNAVHNVGILMTDTYQPGAAFIRALRDWQYGPAAEPAGRATRLVLTFSNVSFVGPDALARQLDADTVALRPAKPYSDGVFVTQVVPNYAVDLADTAKRYRDETEKRKVNRSFTSFEGFINGLVLINGFRTIPGAVTPETTIKALEEMPDLNLGLNVGARYAAGAHNYLRGIWITEVNAAATFRDAYVWLERTEAKNIVSIETL
jgi:branched-chain amino acid transport system substrate-binding protein